MAWYLEGLTLFGLVLAILRTLRYRRVKLPPGPKGWPIFGNSLDAPKRYEWKTYQRWSQQYGSPIISMNLSGTPVIIINTAEVAQDLLEKRSSIYGDSRGISVGWDFNIALMRYGEHWRASRRAFHQYFRPNAVVNYLPQTTKWMREFARRLLDSPEDFMEHITYIPGSLIMDIVYGIQVLPKHDPYIDAAEEALVSLSEAGNPGNFLVDTIPALRYIPDWFPGARFKHLAKKWRQHTTTMIDLPFKFVKISMRARTTVPSVLASMLERLGEDAENTDAETCLRDAAATAYSGGSHTTVSALGTFFLAMVIYPEVQKKAQAEIDRVIGRERPPRFGDEDGLPYITAIVKEVWRWNPVLPTGELFTIQSWLRSLSELKNLAIPHRVIRDDEYMGYDIPSGSIVIGNTWAILHDENVYPNADTFLPERWLTQDGELNPDIPAPEAAFGYGRRVCPGRHLASFSVWLAVATVLWAFRLEKPLDKDGRPITPASEFTPGLLSYPQPFKCVIDPRSPDVRKILFAQE
ncbi:hypothetical protein EIP86_000923 [Pleurotus ostreatoroseus]|nr:hypothetical protein EIP86_000923 [Pleurotus ostreatoroseus]